MTMNGRTNKKRIVWVTFDFPPRISSGVFRPIKIYKYLDKSAWEVDFITHGQASRFDRSVLDHTLLAEVHPVPAVYRVLTIIPHDVLLRLAAWLRRPTARPVNQVPASAGERASGRASPTREAPKRLKGAIYGLFAMLAYFPDHLFLWGWSAALKTLWLHFRRPYDVIYTTSYPESAHLSGFVLALFDVTWVVDYRYGGPMWIKDVVGLRKPPLRERVDSWYQRRVLRTADYVITQSERIRSDFCRVFALDPDRVLVIPSGYDEADFGKYDKSAPPAPFQKREDEIHLLHVGTFEGVGERDRGRILDALNELGRALQNRGRSLVMHAVGSDLFRPDQKPLIGFQYRHYGVIVHCNIPPYLLTADCYLLSTMTTSHGDVQGFIPSKLWEYLRAGRPILTVGPKGEVWAIIERAGTGLHMGLNGEGAAPMDGLAERLLSRITGPTRLDRSVTEHSWESRARTLETAFQHADGAASPGQRRGEAVA